MLKRDIGADFPSLNENFMFQTFEPVSDRSFAGKHLPLLRAEMKKQNLDGFIVPHDDEYQNEYIPAYAERLMCGCATAGISSSA